jgi:hypothetical protein
VQAARKGKAAEQLIAALCVLATGSELNAFTALVDDEGVDLAFKQRDGQPKVQVNPRIYHGIWRRYEELVDELPRERRRGALTALVNAVLAQHAPRDVDEARAAITWLRQAESRDAPKDAG